MKYRVYSDLHLECDVWNNKSMWVPPIQDDEKEQILILAGDLFYGVLSIEWIRGFHQRFKRVLVVLGNHDYWHQKKIDETISFYRSVLHQNNMDNVYLLHNNCEEFYDVIFYGGTMWTDLDRGNPVAEINAPKIMVPDFEFIKDMSVSVWKKQHSLFLYGLSALLDNEPEKPVFVISHHLPSFSSVHEKYHGSHMNPYYYSDLDHFMHYNDQIKVWCHGHTHDTFDYHINQARVICNPRGYNGENDDFYENAVFEM